MAAISFPAVVLIVLCQLGLSYPYSTGYHGPIRRQGVKGPPIVKMLYNKTILFNDQNMNSEPSSWSWKFEDFGISGFTNVIHIDSVPWRFWNWQNKDRDIIGGGWVYMDPENKGSLNVSWCIVEKDFKHSGVEYVYQLDDSEWWGITLESFTEYILLDNSTNILKRINGFYQDEFGVGFFAGNIEVSLDLSLRKVDWKGRNSSVIVKDMFDRNN